MKRYIAVLCITFTALMGFLIITPAVATVSAASAANCGQSNSGILGFPTWYKYLNPHWDPGDPGADPPRKAECAIDVKFPDAIPKILLAVVEIALRIGGLVAVGFVIYGGFQYILAQGEPDKAASARRTIINALIGLVIATLATVIVSFIAGSLT